MAQLIAHGANPNEKTLGKTALHAAAINDKMDAVCLLLYCGADIDARDDLGYTAASYASLSEAAGMEKFLTNYANANVEERKKILMDYANHPDREELFKAIRL